MGLLAALLINRITKNGRIKLDAAIGIVTTAMFALGVVIISRVRAFTQSFEAALFGNILGITGEDLLVIGLVTTSTMTAMFFMYRPLLFFTFDNEAARVFGIRTGIVQLVFSLLLTLSIIASMNVVGVTMIALLSLAQTADGADERASARQPRLAGFMAAASTESQPQTHYALAAPTTCPYHFASTMPSFTYCVYRGVALDRDEQVCATDVVVIWSRFGSQTAVDFAAEGAPGPAREVYLGFVADPDLVLRAIADSWQGDHAAMQSYSMGRNEAPRPLAGEMTLRTVGLGSSRTADVLGVELREPQRFRPGDCAFASYSGTFIGVIGPLNRTEPASDASSKSRQ
jgi:hypothetical protein